MTPAAPRERLEQQLLFIKEIDKVKSIFRRNLLLDSSRRENDAEHSWHLAVMALVLGEYAPAGTDLCAVIRMVLIHDLVEIDAGDTYLYDDAGHRDKAEREAAAARRIFGLLPPEQGTALLEIWEEFEEGRTPEARFAHLLDRFQPFLHNFEVQGVVWKENRISRSQVLDKIEPHLREFPLFCDFLKEKVALAVEKGWLLP